MTPARIDYLLERFGDVVAKEEPRALMQAFYDAMAVERFYGCVNGPEATEAFFWFRDGWRARERATAADFARAATSG